MSDHETELWEVMLCCAVSRAGTVSIGPTAVVENLVQQLGHDGIKMQVFFHMTDVTVDLLLGPDRLSRIPRLCLILFSHVALVDQDKIPTQIFSLVNKTFHDLYPPHPELFPTCFKFLSLTRDIITSSPSLLVVPVLVALRKSLCRWIEDRLEILLEKEYNDIVRVLLTLPFTIISIKCRRSCPCTVIHFLQSDSLLLRSKHFILLHHFYPRPSQIRLRQLLVL